MPTPGITAGCQLSPACADLPWIFILLCKRSRRRNMFVSSSAMPLLLSIISSPWRWGIGTTFWPSKWHQTKLMSIQQFNLGVSQSRAEGLLLREVCCLPGWSGPRQAALCTEGKCWTSGSSGRLATCYRYGLGFCLRSSGRCFSPKLPEPCMVPSHLQQDLKPPAPFSHLPQTTFCGERAPAASPMVMPPTLKVRQEP